MILLLINTPNFTNDFEIDRYNFKVLLTPIRRDRIVDDHQRNYNHAHKKTRVIIEHCFGVIKKRFPALLNQLRCLKLENVQAMIGTVNPEILINV